MAGVLRFKVRVLVPDMEILAKVDHNSCVNLVKSLNKVLPLYPLVVPLHSGRNAAMKCLARFSLVLGVGSVLLMGGAVVLAGNWPQWRGPTDDGICTEKNLPVE